MSHGGQTQQTDGGDGGSSWTESKIETVVATWVVGMIYAFRDRVLEALIQGREIFIGALEDGGASVMGAVVYVAEVPITIYDVLGTTLAGIAASAGPFAPIVVIIAWAIAGLLLAALVRFVVWLLPLVIPWL